MLLSRQVLPGGVGARITTVPGKGQIGTACDPNAAVVVAVRTATFLAERHRQYLQGRCLCCFSAWSWRRSPGHQVIRRDGIEARTAGIR